MAVRLFVGNMPYGATEADLRTHFGAVGEPSQIVIPVDRETGRPRVSPSSSFWTGQIAEQAINKFNQQPFMGRTLSVSEARPREERTAAGFVHGRRRSRLWRRRSAARRRRVRRTASGGAPADSVPAPAAAPGAPNRNFGPPKKKSASSEKRWENKERGPKGPIKERYTGRLGGLYDDENDRAARRRRISTTSRRARRHPTTTRTDTPHHRRRASGPSTGLGAGRSGRSVRWSLT